MEYLDLASNKSKRYNFAIFILIIILIWGLIKRPIEINKALLWEFQGKVQSVTYDDKRNAWITVKNKQYFLFFTSWDSNIKIYPGDSVIKRKGTLKITVIRNKTNIKYVF